MTANNSHWRHWPALADGGTAKLLRFVCAQGVWGKRPDAGSDLRWLALSPDFAADAQQRARDAYLGSEDAPAPVLLWRSEDTVCQAAHCYPGRGDDATNGNFLERRFIEWTNARRLPAALAALALLPRVDHRADATWRVRGANDQTDGAAPLEPLRFTISDADYELSERIAEGCRDLKAAVSAAALAAMYAQLLAGNRLVRLPEARTPLTPCAFAVLLLPLKRPVADQVTMLSHLPSTRLDLTRFSPGADGAALQWHLIGCGDAAADLLPPPAYPSTDELCAIGAAMARALLDNDPGALAAPASQTAPLPQSTLPPDAGTRDARPPSHPPAFYQSTQPRRQGTREVRIWGAASSGKTAYLAQLLTKLDHGDTHWSVRMPHGSDQAWFKGMRENFRMQNRFPAATPVGANDQLAYRLTNEKDGRDAVIALEDRPGKVFEDFDQDTARRLADAHGLMLLIDPRREPAKQNEEVWNAFEAMHQARRDDLQDPRPLAVCVSKCDEYIHTVEAFRQARDTPEVFLRDLIGQTITDTIAHYFSNARLFALSAAGLCITHGAVQPSVFYDENFEPRISSLGRPMNLLEPLVWILDELKA